MKNTITKESFALALSMHRERLRLTQAEMAKLLDVSPRCYWQWEHGTSRALPVAMEGAIERLRVAVTN